MVHSIIVYRHEHVFQVIFDLALLSLSDGYTTESASSFSTSLEIFFEFVVFLIMLSDGVKGDDLEKCLNSVIKQSERQLGAYIFVYPKKFKKTSPLPPGDYYPFRNKVIHQGKIPTENEAIQFS
jgi:hypothetical protein